MHGDEGWMWHDGWGWGGWALMVITMVLVLAAILTVVVLAIRYLTRNSTSSPPRYSLFGRAEDVLAERYAQGELDDDEYRRRLSVLRNHRAAP